MNRLGLLQLIKGAFRATVQPTTLTANRTITVPDATGTVILGSSASVTDANARIGVRRNSTGSPTLRRTINLIEGSNVAITISDDSGNEEIDTTITAYPGNVELASPEGLTISRNTGTPNTHLDISPGRATVVSATTRDVAISATTFTKRIDNTWVAGSGNGGRFSAAGSLGANQTWHVFLLRNDTSGAVDFGFDSSATAANRPAGWSARRIGSWLTDGSNNLRDIRQVGSWFAHATPLRDSYGAVSAANYLYSLYVPAGLKIETRTGILWNNSSGGFVALAVSDPDLPDPNASSVTLIHGQSSPSVDYGAEIRAMCNTSRQIRVGVNSATTILNVSTIGWIDERRDFTAPSLAAEVTTYVTAVEALGGTVNTARRNALNTLIQGLTADGLLSKVRYLLIHNACDGFTGSNVPLLRPSGLGNAVYTSFVSGDWSSTGLAAGSNKFLDTLFVPSAVLSSVNSQFYGMFVSSGPSGTTAIRMGHRVSSNDIYVQFRSPTAGVDMQVNSGVNDSFVADASTNQFVTAQRTSATQQELFCNGTRRANNTSIASAQTLATASIYGFAWRQAGGAGIDAITGRVAMHIIGDGLSNAEHANLYTRLNTCRTALEAA